MADTYCDLKLNPDITGIGVRVALYAQIMLGWVMSLVWPDTYVESSRSAYMTAMALLIASFIQLQTQELSLLDGLVVSLITSMMIAFAIASGSIQEDSSKPGNKTPNNPAPNVPPLSSAAPASTAPDTTTPDNTVPEKTAQNDTTQGDAAHGDPAQNDSAQNKTNPRRYVTPSFIQFCFTIFWAAWSFNLWKDPAHFGLRGEKASCPPNHDVTLSIFGREIDATDPRMRSAALVLVSIGLFIAFCSMWLTLEQVMGPITRSVRRNKQNTSQTTLATRKKKYYEDPVFLGTQGIAIATLIYLTVSTEKTISKNDFARTTREWSYGQTIALILLLPQVMTVFSTWTAKREEKEKEEEEKRQRTRDV